MPLGPTTAAASLHLFCDHVAHPAHSRCQGRLHQRVVDEGEGSEALQGTEWRQRDTIVSVN